MTLTLLAWIVLGIVLAMKSVTRPSYAIGLYMLTFFAAPLFWWWGDPIEGYRWNFYAALVLLVTVVATRDRVPMTREHPLSSNAVRILFFLAANAALVHVLFAANPESSLGWLIIKLKFILLFFLLQYAIRDEKDFRIAAVAIALGMGYIGYEATINERGSFSGGRLEGIGAAGIQSSNQLASLFIAGIPIATAVFFTGAHRWTKAATGLCCAFAFNVVLLCNSRGGFLGVLVAGVVFMGMASGPARKRAFGLAGVALVGAFLLLGDPEIVARFMTIFTEEGQRDNSAQSRIVFWTAAGEMIRDYPLGSGGNSFSEGRGSLYMGRGEGETRAVHNGYITELADWGFQGFGLMLLFIGATWRTAFRGRRLALDAGDANAVMVFACFGAALAGWMVTSVFGDYLDEEWGYWTMAMVYSYIRVHTFAPSSTQVPAPGPAAFAASNRLSIPSRSPVR